MSIISTSSIVHSVYGCLTAESTNILVVDLDHLPSADHSGIPVSNWGKELMQLAEKNPQTPIVMIGWNPGIYYVDQCGRLWDCSWHHELLAHRNLGFMRMPVCKYDLLLIAYSQWVE
jgi:hypothetical protein